MRRIYTIVTPDCPIYPSRKVGKDCRSCPNFRGGIVENFVDCGADVPMNTKTKLKTKTKEKCKKTMKASRKGCGKSRG